MQKYQKKEGKWKTLKYEIGVWKRKYRREKKSYLPVFSALLTMTVTCRQRVTVSKRCESQALTHQTPASTNSCLAWHGEYSLVVVSFWDYSDNLWVSLEYFCCWLSHEQRTIWQHSHLHHCQDIQEHRACMIDPLTVCLGLGLAVTCIGFNSDAHRSPKPKIHRRDWVTFCYKASTHTFMSQ